MSARELVVCLTGKEVGRVVQNTHGRLQFTYAESWLRASDAYPLSLSMPLQVQPHGHARIDAFLWGLLPDNAAILRSWSKRFQVSARNAFALLGEVGEDCAGAVQFARPERIEALLTAGRGRVTWLSETDVAERLRALRADVGAWRMGGDTGQFSLAGAQPKTALLFDRGRWGIPSGRTPTTHILKPPNAQLDGFAENEHFCLELGRALGLPTAHSRVMHFGDEPAIVVERYDRLRMPKGWVRIHQEDLCQALGVSPARKYQNDGGPGARTIVDVLRTHSSATDEDTATFVGALIFNYLIAGTDAHAKNYSLLIAPAERVRLAPLYDLASVLPYARFDVNRVKLAMKVGDKYRLRDITAREWRKAATDFRMDPEAVVARVVRMTEEMPDRTEDLANKLRAAGLDHPVIDRLRTRLIGRARADLTSLRRTGNVRGQEIHRSAG